MKTFTSIAIGVLAVLGAIAAIGIFLKKKAEKEVDFDEYDEIMNSEDDFDDFFDEEDEVIGEETAPEVEEVAEDEVPTENITEEEAIEEVAPVAEEEAVEEEAE